MKPASKILTALGIFSLIFFSACEDDPSFLGKNILPPSDEVQSRFTDENEINSNTVTSKPVVTTISPQMLIGSSTDSIFGFSKADFMTRFDISPAIITGDLRVDSLVIEMQIDGFFGDSTTAHTFRIYELTDTLLLDSVYYSNTLPDGKYDPQEIASGIVYPTDTLARVKIDYEDLLQRFENVDDSIFADPEDFFNFFLGFYITSDNINEGGSIIYLDILDNDSRMIMYYQTDDTTGTKQIFMPVNEFTPRVNSFYHDYQGSRVARYLDNPGTEDTLMYISAMAGVNGQLSFPDLEEWLDRKPVAINKAQLYLPVEDTMLTGLSRGDFPFRLNLYSYDEENNFDFLYDYRIDEDNTNHSYFDGNFDVAEQAYIFNIGVHLQSYIQGDVDNLNLILQSSQNSLTASRVVLKGPGAKGRKIELRIVYTEF
jgi:hypothetical protein